MDLKKLKKEDINDLSEEQVQACLDALKEQIFLNTMLYEEESQDATYTEDKDTINKRIEPLKDLLREILKDNEKWLNKVLACDYFLKLLAHIDFIDNEDNVLDYERMLDLAEDYDKVNNFFKRNGDEAFTIYEEYGIVETDDEGYFKLNDNMISKIVKDSGFSFNSDDDLKAFKNIVYETWENQKEILTQDSLNKDSEARNGINFKHFIFCEEYIKRGKIKPTCDYLGISRNTAYLWLKDDKVQKYLKDRQDEIKKETDDTFTQTYRESFNELNKMIKSNYIQTSDKIKAIDTFLKHYENIERLKQPLTSYED